MNFATNPAINDRPQTLGDKLFEIEQRAKAVAHTAVVARTAGGVSEEMIRELVDVIDRLWKAAGPLRLEGPGGERC